MRNKLKSFTLLETLIVLVVIVVVIASVFSVFLLVMNYFNTYYTKKNQSHDFVFFDKILDREIFLADSVVRSEDQGFTIYIKDRKINYTLVDSAIVRFETAADTFHVAVLDNKITCIEPASFLINKITFSVRVNGDIIVPVYTKRYAADTYLKYAIRN